MEKSNANLQDNFFYGFLGLTTISLLMPWINIPIIGGFSPVSDWRGIIVLICLLGILGLYFYNRSLSYFASLIFVGGMILYAIYFILRLVFISVDIGIFGEFSPLMFIGFGVYVFIIGGILTVFKSFIELKKENSEYLKFGIIGGILFFIIILIISNSDNIMLSSTTPTIMDNNIETTSNEPENLETIEFSFGETISFEGLELRTISFEYDDTSDDMWRFESSAYVLSFEIRNTNNFEITNCDYDFYYINSLGDQIIGHNYYGAYSLLLPNARTTFEVRFRDSFRDEGGIIYIRPSSFFRNDNTCPNFNIKINK